MQQMMQQFAAYMQQQQIVQQQYQLQERLRKARQAVTDKLQRFEGRDISKFCRLYEQSMEDNGIQDRKAVDGFHLIVVLEIRTRIVELQTQQGTDCWPKFKKALMEEYFLEDSQRVTKQSFMKWINRKNKDAGGQAIVADSSDTSDEENKDKSTSSKHKLEEPVLDDLVKGIQELNLNLKAVKLEGLSSKGSTSNRGCMWCDSKEHERRDCDDFKEAYRKNVVFWKDNKIHLKATGEPLRLNSGRGGMKKLAEEIQHNVALVLKSQNTALQESLCNFEKSGVVQLSTKQEEVVPYDKRTSCRETSDIVATSTSLVNDILSEMKEAHNILKSDQAHAPEDEQVIGFSPEIFQTHTIIEPKLKKGDLSHYPQRHVALKIMYLGARFHGFASDASPQRTVELELFRALEKTRLVTKGRLEAKYTRCGRTDKGVSANGQVVALLLRSRQKHSDHMNVSKREDRVAAAIYSRSEELHFSQMIDYEEIDYVGILNRALPPDIRILGWCYVPLNFHARFSCLAREYNYFFLNDGLDIEAMKRAAKKFCGEHDFRNFCRMDADSVQNFRREILALEILPCLETWEGFEIWMFRVQGTAFLWHQVRCMVAVLLMVGQDKEHESVVDYLLDIHQATRKPQYVMAPELPLVLQSCKFQGLSFYCSPSSTRFLHLHLKNMMSEHLNAIALLKQLNLELPRLDGLETSNISTCKKLSHVPLSCRPTEPTYAERKTKLLSKGHKGHLVQHCYHE
ncbi:hypothetical protein L7F22_031188 [Adiantum nelumboides]|nr:hypothetical protein [Adiantum nelumboides]